MNHAEATRTGAAERYALGQMGEQERDTYEEHFFVCPECAEEVRAAAVFLDNAKPVLLAMNEEPEPSPKAHPSHSPVWPGWRGLFWPLPLGAAAAAALLLGLVGYQALVLVPGLRRELREADSLQPAPGYFLSVSRGEAAPVVATSGRERHVALRLSRPSDRPLPFYRCEVEDASGRAVLSSVVPAPPPGDELQILLPVGGLRPGTYAITVAGLESASSPSPAPASIARYPFTLERRDPTGARR